MATVEETQLEMQRVRERQETFLREHRAQAAIWGPVIPYHIPCAAGPGPTASQTSPASDPGDGSKA